MKYEFDPEALQDLKFWKRENKKTFEKIFTLLEAIENDPIGGIGKPEPLRGDLSGCWSRRITKEHRLVYKVENNTLFILSCRYHYR